MPVEIRVPQLGESVVEATVSRWMKKEGDPVQAGEALAELETDKVNVEVYADSSGVLSRLVKGEGETVGVGEVLGEIAESSSGAASESTPAPTLAPVPSPESVSTDPGETSNGEAAGEPDALVSPMARRLADESHLDLRQVKGSGPGGRILKDDVATFIERSADAPETANILSHQAATAPRNPSTPTLDAAPTPKILVAAPSVPASTPSATAQAAATPASDRPEERVRMTRRRQTIATRLVEAQHTAAMLTTFNEVDMTAVMEVRKRRRDSFKERHGVGLGFMSFFTKATIGALKAFPYLNAEIQGTEIVVKQYYDMGIAVSTEEGLVVPVVRNADRLSFAGVEKAIGDVATRAREGKLTLSDLQGGTFTLTNGGIFGSLMSTPILNAPQVGILGMHKIEERAVVKDGQIVARPMMYLALSYDHRIVDGSEAVRFLVRVKELIEDPESLLLEG